jgi:hypothetical protein
MPKYAVFVEDVVSRSCTITVEAPDARTAEAQVRTLFEAGGPEADHILDMLSNHPDDVDTTFACTEDDQLLDEAALTNFNSDSD